MEYISQFKAIAGAVSHSISSIQTKPHRYGTPPDIEAAIDITYRLEFPCGKVRETAFSILCSIEEMAYSNGSFGVVVHEVMLMGVFLNALGLSKDIDVNGDYEEALVDSLNDYFSDPLN